MVSRTVNEALEAPPTRGATSCRHCESALSLSLVDLGKSPLCQTVLSEQALGEAEVFYPLHAKVCTSCWLVQIPEFVAPDGIFSEYAYFSAYSDSWVDHARRYVDMIAARLALGPDDLVVELASNDGYLLQHFLPLGIPVLGIDPARNVAEMYFKPPSGVEMVRIDAATLLRGNDDCGDSFIEAFLPGTAPEGSCLDVESESDPNVIRVGAIEVPGP